MKQGLDEIRMSEMTRAYIDTHSVPKFRVIEDMQVPSHARRRIFAIAIVIVCAFHLIGDSNKTRSKGHSGQLMSPNSTCTAAIHERKQLENVYK